MLVGDVIPLEWSQRALWALREALDVDADLKGQMVDFLLATQLWNITLAKRTDKRPLSRDEEELAIRSAALHRFNCCLNPGQDQRFTWQVIMALCERFERPALLQFMADGMGYQLVRVPTEDRWLRAIERLCAARDSGEALTEEENRLLASMGTHPRLMKIHPAIRAGNASFCKPEDDTPGGRL